MTMTHLALPPILIPLLILHIGAGMVAIVTGAAALTARKGARAHRAIGTVFFVAMLTMATMAAILAVSLRDVGNTIGGVFAFYLVATAWATVKRQAGTVGVFEVGAMLVAFVAAALMLLLGFDAAAHPADQPMSAPPLPAYFIFASIAALVASLDLKVVLRGGVSGAPRITRHLWRMCLALFFASGSFFIGQQKVMPRFMHGSPVLLVLGLAPLAVMAFWLLRLRLTRAYAGEPVAA
jgi:uncharacterized membrane protein